MKTVKVALGALVFVLVAGVSLPAFARTCDVKTSIDTLGEDTLIIRFDEVDPSGAATENWNQVILPASIRERFPLQDKSSGESAKDADFNYKWNYSAGRDGKLGKLTVEHQESSGFPMRYKAEIEVDPNLKLFNKARFRSGVFFRRTDLKCDSIGRTSINHLR